MRAEIINKQAAGRAFVNVPSFSKEQAQTFSLGAARVDGWVTDPLISPSDYEIWEQRLTPVAGHAIAVAQGYLTHDPSIAKALNPQPQWSLRIMNGGGAGSNLCVKVSALPMSHELNALRTKGRA